MELLGGGGSRAKRGIRFEGAGGADERWEGVGAGAVGGEMLGWMCTDWD